MNPQIKFKITVYTKDGGHVGFGAPNYAAALRKKREEERSPLVKKAVIERVK